ncbi:MAG: LysM peptidoglycan-binding domain-containing protein [Proteobacteria bacterium]|nr:LysM peptidoglycan-binding domain-containing protein [Pseudomonadota bacterium]
MTSKFAKYAVLTLFLVAANSGAAGNEALFPRPKALERDVNFWISIFTEYSTREGVLHDNRNLAVVYEKIVLPENASRRTRNRLSKARREYYQKILRALANGKRDNLSAQEYRVLEMWPADVSDKELLTAASRIRFQLGLSDRFREGLKRSGRWRNHVNAEFSRLGVPPELAALPHVESSYNPDARSHVGASGIWQFTRSTGRRFLQVDHILDERNDPFLATTAAAKLLAYNYSITGNWPMAITAYNHGLSGARRAMRQYGDNAYTEILRHYKSRTFGFASRNFYVAFLAAMQIDQNPQAYFPGLVPDRPVDYATMLLPAYIPADKLAAALKVRERDLARHNPAIQATVWQGSKHLPLNFELRMPNNMLSDSLPALMANLSADARFDEQLPDLFHTIRRGDTLSQIADEYRTRVSTLVALNNLGNSNRIRAGQQLRLPAAGPAPVPTPVVVAAAPSPAPTLPASVPPPAPLLAAIADAPAIAVGEVDDEEAPFVFADQFGSLIGSLQAALLSDPSDYTVAEDTTIEVQPLETLGHYADWLGIKTQRLRDINGLAFRAPVVVGQRIKLDLGKVNTESFENLRAAYHRQQQDTFFRNNTITGVTEHVVRSGESVWILALRTYDVPVWLFRQYNPELDLHNVQRGARLNFPILVSNTPG